MPNGCNSAFLKRLDPGACQRHRLTPFRCDDPAPATTSVAYPCAQQSSTFHRVRPLVGLYTEVPPPRRLPVLLRLLYGSAEDAVLFFLNADDRRGTDLKYSCRIATTTA